MKNKSWKIYLVLFTFLFTAFMSPIAFAKQGNGNGNGNGSSNQLQSISSKLDRIEDRLNDVSASIGQYFAGDRQEEETAGDEGATGTAETEDSTGTEDGTAEGETAGDEGVTGTDETDDSTGTEDGTAEEETAGDEGTTGTDETDDSAGTEEGTVDDEDIDEESNDEDVDEEEENISGYSFIGKLNALNNNLNSAENRLDKLAGRIDDDNEEYINLYSELEELRNRIIEQLSELDELESPVLNKMLASTEEQEEFEPGQNIVSPSKEWRIRFNRNLNEQTLSKMNIFVVDSNDSLLEVDVSLDSAEGAVVISPVEEYLSGETYTLFISKDVKSQAGDELKNAVKVVFTVE